MPRRRPAPRDSRALVGTARSAVRPPSLGCGDRDGHYPWAFPELSTGNRDLWAHGNLASCGQDFGRRLPYPSKLPRPVNSLDYNRAAVTPSALTRPWR